MEETTGTLEQVKGTNVLIDGVWYDASNVAKFIPAVNTEVVFSAGENYQLQFIRAKAGTPNRGGSYQRKNFSNKKSYTPKPFNSDSTRTDSIIKQVIFKAAVEEHKLFPERTLDEIYHELKGTYLGELK